MAVILGGTGMLGSMMASILENPDVWERKDLDAETVNWQLEFESRVINCIGLIKPYCSDVIKAIQINSMFPYYLPEGSIQIATDCVFSGATGGYTESDLHDASDTYGQTKSLGEASHLNNLRCSIIGPEVHNHVSLLDWFMRQTKVDGYINHYWNGITTYHFALIVQGILDEGIELPNIQHIVPADSVTKAELLQTHHKSTSLVSIIK